MRQVAMKRLKDLERQICELQDRRRAAAKELVKIQSREGLIPDDDIIRGSKLEDEIYELSLEIDMLDRDYREVEEANFFGESNDKRGWEI